MGADNALGGQKNYFDPANNRRTNQVVTHADGSRTLGSYNDENALGARVVYGPDGRRISASHFDPKYEQLNTKIDYAGDGSRSVLSTGSGQDGVSIKHYNALNQLQRTQQIAGAGEVATYHDPQTGQVTHAVIRGGDDGESAPPGNGQRATVDPVSVEPGRFGPDTLKEEPGADAPAPAHAQAQTADAGARNEAPDTDGACDGN